MKGKIFTFLLIGFTIITIAASIATAGEEPDPSSFMPMVLRSEPTATPTPIPTAAPTSTPVPTVQAPPTSEPPPTGCNTCSANVYNCSDFSRQRDAQANQEYAFCTTQISSQGKAPETPFLGLTAF